MATKNRNELSQQEKHVAFATMAKTYKACVEGGNFVGAHVIAFSFLEDRVTAMNVVLGTKHRQFGDKVKYLKTTTDLKPELAQCLLEAAKVRNKLVHEAMWNLSVFSAEGANHVFGLAREADKARARQKKRLQK